MKCVICLAAMWRKRRHEWRGKEPHDLEGVMKQRGAINDTAEADVVIGGRSLCIQCWLNFFDWATPKRKRK